MRAQRIADLRANCARSRISIKQVAEKCNIAPATLYSNMRAGTISFERLDTLEEAYQEIARQKQSMNITSGAIDV